MSISPQLARYYKLRDQINAKRRQYRAEHRALVNLQAKEYRDTRRDEIRRYNNNYAKKLPVRLLKKVSTTDLIAELERRRPDCKKCPPIENINGDHSCDYCIWRCIRGTKDNFKPKEDR